MILFGCNLRYDPRGGSRIFFRRGCTRLLLYFNTNKPHSFLFFCRIPVVLENCRSSQGGVRTPCTLPLDPPLDPVYLFIYLFNHFHHPYRWATQFRRGWPVTTRVYVPYSVQTVVWVLLHPTRTIKWKCCETGPTVFCPYLTRLESLTICRCHDCKGSIFSSVQFKDPVCWSSQGLIPRPPTQQNSTLPPELTMQSGSLGSLQVSTFQF